MESEKIDQKKIDQTENLKLESKKRNQISFDPNTLRLEQNFNELVGVKKEIVTIPVKKPHKQDFVRVRPGEEWLLETAVLELKEDRETYLVDSSLWRELYGELIPKVLLTTITRTGVLFLWPIRLPHEDGRLDPWNTSALEAAERAQKQWVRVTSNMHLGAYEVFTSIKDFPEPEWPELNFNEILKTAFKDNFINSMDHPAIQKLRGEI